jgi:hypothetical protein
MTKCNFRETLTHAGVASSDNGCMVNVHTNGTWLPMYPTDWTDTELARWVVLRRLV